MAEERTSPQERHEPGEDHTRAKLQSMLVKARTVRAQVASARRDADGKAALDLASVEANIAQVEEQLEGAAVSGAVSEQAVSSLKAVLASAERLAERAVQGAASSENGGKGGSGDLASASAETRRVVQEAGRNIFERKVFDPYLRFGSKEEEDDYHRREDQRKSEIERLTKENTPESNRHAAEITLKQLDDAGQHGAKNSPDFAPMYQQISAAKAKLDRTLAQSQQSISHTNDHGVTTQDDMRRRLESKGIPPDTVTRILAEADPIRAARQYTMPAHPSSAMGVAEPAHPFEGEHHPRQRNGAAPPEKKAGPEASVLAGFDLGSLGLAVTPEPIQTAQSEAAKPAHIAQAAGINLAGLGLSAEPATGGDSGHGLPDQAKPAVGNRPAVQRSS